MEISDGRYDPRIASDSRPRGDCSCVCLFGRRKLVLFQRSDRRSHLEDQHRLRFCIFFFLLCLTQIYLFNVSGGDFGSFTSSSPAVMEVDESNALVFIGDITGLISAYNAADGTQAWITANPGKTQRVYASPIVFNSTVFVGADDHAMHALDALTGKPRWTFATRDLIRGGAAVSVADGRGFLYFGSNDGYAKFTVMDLLSNIRFVIAEFFSPVFAFCPFVVEGTCTASTRLQETSSSSSPPRRRLLPPQPWMPGPFTLDLMTSACTPSMLLQALKNGPLPPKVM